MVAGTPFSYAHSFAQTGPFRPAEPAARRRKTWCSRVAARYPASGSRPRCCPGGWPPTGSPGPAVHAPRTSRRPDDDPQGAGRRRDHRSRPCGPPTAVPDAQRPARPHLLPRHPAAAAAPAPRRARPVRLRAMADDLVDEPAADATPADDRRRDSTAVEQRSLGAGSRRPQRRSGARAPSSTPPRGTPSTAGAVRAFFRSMRMDLTVTDYPTRAGAGRLHARLGRSHRAADAARARHGDRPRRGGAARRGAGQGVPADELPARRRRGPRPRPRLPARPTSSPRSGWTATGWAGAPNTASRTRGCATRSPSQIAFTRALYEQARPGIAMLHPVSRACVATAFPLYAGILDRIERAGYNVFGHRAAVPRPRRPGRRGRRTRPGPVAAAADPAPTPPVGA